MTPTRLAAILMLAGLCAPAAADNLYRGSNWPAMSADRRASEVGDLLTVVIFQTAESSNVAPDQSHKGTDLSGSIGAGHLNEQGSLSFGGGYTGRGEVTRSEKLVAQLTLAVTAVLPNGDLLIGGEQFLNVNGERTRIGVRGRVRSADIRDDNSILSSRIANAEINYDGRGFVSRSAKPGLLNRIFSFLGLG
jgi:flagellar L-ring protein FlgH